MSIPWPYRADRPQRYFGNYGRYRQLGGPVDLEEWVQGFVAGDLNHSDMARFYFFCLVFDQIVKEDLRGDVAELGVYKGNTAALLAGIARARGQTAYLLDTFEGFDNQDLKGVDATAKKGAFSDTSLEGVRKLVGDDNVCYVAGHFPASASQIPYDCSFCLVHLDCDLYLPISSALSYFYPRLVPGGFLIVHDYSSLHWNGAEKAVDEFFADKAEPVIPLPDSAGSVVIRKARVESSSENWLARRRSGLLRTDWVSAANGGISELLGDGWSAPETWGVWGVGASHQLRIVLTPPYPAEILLEMDVHAALFGERTGQIVDVQKSGTSLAVWEFTQQANRAVRTVRLPVGAAPTAPHVSLVIEFRPRSVRTPAELNPAMTETRPLGLALHRIRALGPELVR